MIKVQGLSHSIGGARILRDISVTLPKGQVTALIGPNGAGKSTLLSLIARLVRAQSGRVLVDELEVGRAPSREMAKRLAILPQTPDVAPRLTVAELVGFGRYPHARGRLGPEDRAAVDEAIATFELGDLSARAIDTLSGGQRQKALLAMIFAQGTDYVLLDEPLNNLDIAGARGLMAVLCAAAKAQGKTVVIVLHDIAYALAYADHVVILAGGQVMAEGAPGEVITEARLHETYGTDARLHRVDGRLLLDVGPR